MFMLVRFAQRALCVCLFLSSATAAFAQIETGQLTGKVSNAAGAALPGVTIAVKAVETAAERKTISNSAGLYAVGNLQPGAYEITVTAKDFLPSVLKLQIAVGAREVFNFALETAPPNARPDAAQVIEGPDLAIQSVSQTLSTVITQKQIRDLPSLTRNPYDFVLLAGNVVPIDPIRRGNNTAVAINGQRASSVNFLQDGQVNNSQFAGSPGQRVPLESVQEFSVVSGGLSAEYGRAAGGVVNVVTKTGTNSFHGTAFGFNRVSALSSKDFNTSANGLEKGTFRRNQYGYSVGGPAIEDKLLFFNATEWTKVRSRADVISIAPSSDLISASAEATRAYFGKYGLRTGLPADNDDNKDKLYTKSEIAGLFPIIKGGSFDKLRSDRIVFGQVENRDPVDAGGGDPQDTLQSVVRIDYNFSNKETIALRYGTDRQTLFDGTNSNSPWNGFSTGTRLQNDTFSLSLTQAHNARLTTQTRLAGNRLKFTQPLGGAGEAGAVFLRQHDAHDRRLFDRPARLSNARQPRHPLRRADECLSGVSGRHVSVGQTHDSLRRAIQLHAGQPHQRFAAKLGAGVGQHGQFRAGARQPGQRQAPKFHGRDRPARQGRGRCAGVARRSAELHAQLQLSRSRRVCECRLARATQHHAQRRRALRLFQRAA
jgi:hypothetical protein